MFHHMPTLADASKLEWQFITKMKTHEVVICSICFGDGLDEDGNLYHRLHEGCSRSAWTVAFSNTRSTMSKRRLIPKIS